MTNGQTLFLILSLLYLSDCLIWLGRRSVLFYSPWCRRWLFKYADQFTGNGNGSIKLLNPLPPLGVAFFGHWIPISISPDGVCDMTTQVVGELSRPGQTGRVLLYEQIADVRTDGKNLMLNKARFSKCASADQADILAELIRQVSREPAETRERLIHEFIDALFSKKDALARLEQTSDAVSELRWMGTSFFIFLYMLVPLLSYMCGFGRFLIPVVMIMLLSACLVAVQYARAHKRLYPLKKSERVGNIVKMVLCPPVAIRAGDLLSLESLSCFHPILIGSLVLSAEVAQFYRPLIRDIQHPLKNNRTETQARSIVSWYSTVERDVVERFLKLECSTTFDDFLAPPLWDEISMSYCPRCSCQFSLLSGECPDCPGVETLPMADAKHRKERHEQR